MFDAIFKEKTYLGQMVARKLRNAQAGRHCGRCTDRHGKRERLRRRIRDFTGMPHGRCPRMDYGQHYPGESAGVSRGAWGTFVTLKKRVHRQIPDSHEFLRIRLSYSVTKVALLVF